MTDSPTQKTSTFFVALAAITSGAKATKLEWGDKSIYVLLRNSRLQIHRDGNFFDLIVTEGDLIGRDWVLLSDYIT